MNSSSSCFCCATWWIVGLVWHGGMLGMLATAVVRRWPNEGFAALVAVLTLYLAVNCFLTHVYYNYELQQQQQQQQLESSAEQATTTDETSRRPTTDDDPTTPPPAPLVAVSSSQQRKRPNHHYLRNVPLYLSLTYLLTHLSWTLPGGLAVLLWFPCPLSEPRQEMEHYWVTNTSTFSPVVMEWMQHAQLSKRDSFVQLPNGEVYLKGSYKGSDNVLYAVPYQQEPVDLGYANVFDLTRVSNTTVCFTQVEWSQTGRFDVQISIGCGNVGRGFTTALVNQKRRSGGRHENVALFSLQGLDGLLWFRLVTEDYRVAARSSSSSTSSATPQSTTSYPTMTCDFDVILNYDSYSDKSHPIDCPWDTFAVLSMNITTMQVTSYSARSIRIIEPQDMVYENVEEEPPIAEEYYDDEETEDQEGVVKDFFETGSNSPEGAVDVPESNDDEDFDDDDATVTVIHPTEPLLLCPNHESFMSTQRALGGLFLSCLPMAVASARAWIKFAIPSASISLFCAIGLLCMFGWAAMDPWSQWTGLLAWLFFGTPLWTVVCTYQLVVNPRVSRQPLWWSLHFILTSLLCVLLFAEYQDLSRPLYFVHDRGWQWAMELGTFVCNFWCISDARAIFLLTN